MSLSALRHFDPTTASGILAAAALATAPNPGPGEPDLVAQYRDEVRVVLAEIRNVLKLGAEDQSARARAAIDQFISKALDDAVFAGSSVADALARAGNAGRLSPGMYNLIQPSVFVDGFRRLGVRKQHVEEAVKNPDDFQHLMTEYALDSERDMFSLFMKLVPNRGVRPAHWLLVHTIRRGIDLIVQSAWRILPAEVNLDGASVPLDVLARFSDAFGVDVRVGAQKGKLLVSESFPKQANASEIQFDIEIEAPARHGELFASFSHRALTKNPNIFVVGIAFCIDIDRYKSSLKRNQLLG